MKLIRFALAILTLIWVQTSNDVFAQQPDGFDPSEFGFESAFPTPPNSDNASAIVNINLDYADLNAGKNLLHYDEAAQVKLFVYYIPSDEIYSLTAQTQKGKDLKIRVSNSEEDPNCIFARIGPDWINVICSEKMRYVAELPKVKKDEKKDGVTSTPASKNRKE